MCGIVGYIGNKEAQPILLDGLSKLEYRGYDSAGIAVQTTNGLEIVKSVGQLINLENRVGKMPLRGTVGIGHTRWATHGKPSELNSHPQLDESQKFSVVHNGIIENYTELKDKLVADGHKFVSETDTEVIAHLLSEAYQGDLVQAVQQVAKMLRGSFALGILTCDEPERLVAIRQASPLVVGKGNGENFIASDIPAVLEHTREIYILEDGEMAVLTRGGIDLFTIEGEVINKDVFQVDWDVKKAERDGFDFFMLKEIYEQPKAYEETMLGYIKEDGFTIQFPHLNLTSEQLQEIDRVHIVACGTALHAGLVGKMVLENMIGLPTETDMASEYRYRAPIITSKTLVIVVSQSGETADTLAALREAKDAGASVLAITNVIGSSVAREADGTIITLAGPEIAVASTKAYTSQLIAFYLFAIYWANLTGKQPEEKLAAYIIAMQILPSQVRKILQKSSQLENLGKLLAEHQSLFFIGRGLDYMVAMEGSLKLKEISYLHSEAYAAGELKHGTLALVEEGTPIVALLTQPQLHEKMISNIKETKARGAKIIAIINEGDEKETLKFADEVFAIPQTVSLFAPALSVITLQLLAYYSAISLGRDVDKPRNLAKSVTVE